MICGIRMGTRREMHVCGEGTPFVSMKRQCTQTYAGVQQTRKPRKVLMSFIFVDVIQLLDGAMGICKDASEMCIGK